MPWDRAMRRRYAGRRPAPGRADARLTLVLPWPGMDGQILFLAAVGAWTLRTMHLVPFVV